MVIAEKLVTALQRGAATTRWRDFADLYLLLAVESPATERIARSIAAVAEHRVVPLSNLGETLDGMAEIAQRPWEAWVKRHGFESRVPDSFAELLSELDQRTRPWLAAANACIEKE